MAAARSRSRVRRKAERSDRACIDTNISSSECGFARSSSSRPLRSGVEVTARFHSYPTAARRRAVREGPSLSLLTTEHHITPCPLLCPLRRQLTTPSWCIPHTRWHPIGADTLPADASPTPSPGSGGTAPPRLRIIGGQTVRAPARPSICRRSRSTGLPLPLSRPQRSCSAPPSQCLRAPLSRQP